MKKLSLLLFSLFIFNCSSDDAPVDTSSNLFNPPEWIHGEWKHTSGSTSLTFTFTQNNVIEKTTSTNSNTVVDNNEAYKDIIGTTSLPTGTMTLEITEDITDTTYGYTIISEIKISVGSSSSSNEVKFVKVSDTEIKRFVGGFESLLYTKQ